MKIMEAKHIFFDGKSYFLSSAVYNAVLTLHKINRVQGVALLRQFLMCDLGEANRLERAIFVYVTPPYEMDDPADKQAFQEYVEISRNHTL